MHCPTVDSLHTSRSCSNAKSHGDDQHKYTMCSWGYIHESEQGAFLVTRACCSSRNKRTDRIKYIKPTGVHVGHPQSHPCECKDSAMDTADTTQLYSQLLQMTVSMGRCTYSMSACLNANDASEQTKQTGGGWQTAVELVPSGEWRWTQACKCCRQMPNMMYCWAPENHPIWSIAEYVPEETPTLTVAQQHAYLDNVVNRFPSLKTVDGWSQMALQAGQQPSYWSQMSLSCCAASLRDPAK